VASEHLFINERYWMVAARNLEPQKQHIEIQLLHRFEGTYPDVPTSPDVDFEELVKPDREEGVDPNLLTNTFCGFSHI
jgi:hypothetical protein